MPGAADPCRAIHSGDWIGKAKSGMLERKFGRVGARKDAC